MFRRFFPVLVVMVLVGCAPKTKIRYDVGLANVERPSEAIAEYGDQRVFRAEELNGESYNFVDQMVEVKWAVRENEFRFDLTNKTPQILRIIWDDAQFIDENGSADGVIHSGVLLSDAEKPQTPTTVAPGATVDETLIPKSKIFFEEGVYASWQREPLFPESGKSAASYVGKRVQVQLPFEVGGVTNNYVFVFEVNNVVKQ